MTTDLMARAIGALLRRLPRGVQYLLWAELDLTRRGRLIMSLQLKDTEKASYKLEAVDAKGAPTTLGDVPEWSTSDPAVATVAASADGMSAVVSAVKPGKCQVAVHDPGTGLSGSDELTVVAGVAANLVLTPGTPENQ